MYAQSHESDRQSELRWGPEKQDERQGDRQNPLGQLSFDEATASLSPGHQPGYEQQAGAFKRWQRPQRKKKK
jgi:hypothetical protein